MSWHCAQVVPALDPSTPIYASTFTMQLIQKRMKEFNLWNHNRFCKFRIGGGHRFNAGPFEVETIRVTHSIPDCSGLILRSEGGTIVHTGDWKIDETPLDGHIFDRSAFEAVSKEGVTLFMSDSTNVLSSGRTVSEADVEKALIRRVMGHSGKGRVISTQFASNVHRLASIKKAADLSGRKIAFVGMSLRTYLEAAWKDGQAPFDPRELIEAEDIDKYDPNELLIVTTGSQGEPRAALTLASYGGSRFLNFRNDDLLLYSAKMIPGNEGKVMDMMNRVAGMGPTIAMGRGECLHTSGHACHDELEEVLRLVKPQHFLPVHGETAFLYAHANLARQSANVQHTSVIRNGQMLGVAPLRSGRQYSSLGSMSMLGEVKLTPFYNDGENGTGTSEELAIEERMRVAVEGVVVVSVAVTKPEPSPSSETGQVDDKDQGTLKGNIRITTRAMWTDGGRLIMEMQKSAEAAVRRMPLDVTLLQLERTVADMVRRTCVQYCKKRPDVIVTAHFATPDEEQEHFRSVKNKLGKKKTPADYRRSSSGSSRGGGSSRRGRRSSTPKS